MDLSIGCSWKKAVSWPKVCDSQGKRLCTRQWGTTSCWCPTEPICRSPRCSRKAACEEKSQRSTLGWGTAGFTSVPTLHFWDLSTKSWLHINVNIFIYDFTAFSQFPSLFHTAKSSLTDKFLPAGSAGRNPWYTHQPKSSYKQGARKIHVEVKSSVRVH